jgi:chemotaxis protein methyltransferase CheR
LCRALSAATGLRVDDIHMESLERAVDLRIQALELSTGEEYAALLENPVALQAEVEAVITEIMGSETAFFRSREHFDLLKERLVPEILQRVGEGRSVRVWDAGCATGEETYSTAILMDIYFRSFAEGAYIVGSDINPEAIACASAGVYDTGSVEGLDGRELTYFTKSAGRYVLRQRIKDRVLFVKLNLIDGLPSYRRAGVHDMDIVVCRDVLLHFRPEIAQRVIIQFFESIAPGGFLILGQAEGMLTVASPFEHCVYGDAMYCRKPLIGPGGTVRFFGGS